MEFMRPNTVWINGSCYRLMQDTSSDVVTPANYEGDVPDAFIDDVYGKDPSSDDEDTLDDSSMVQTPDGRFSGSLHVPQELLGVVIGKKGATKKKLELETRSKINVPKIGTGGDIGVFADSKNSVASVLRRIKAIVRSARLRQEFTHFVSIPLNLESIKEKFRSFREEALSSFGDEGIVDKAMFQDENMLHITVATLILMDENERMKATKILENCLLKFRNEVIKEKSIHLQISGIEIMNDDEGEADVIYAKVTEKDGSNYAVELAESIRKDFASAGLDGNDWKNVKLHCTLLNSRFINERGARGIHINSKPINDKFANYFFGEIDVSELHISLRRSKTKDGYYRSTAVCKV